MEVDDAAAAASPTPGDSDAGAAAASVSPTPGEGGDGNQVSFRVVFKKVTHEVTFGLDMTVGELKKELEKVTGCPAVSQKLSFKGPLKNDSATLRSRKFANKCKVLLIGPTAEDLLTQASLSAPITDADPLPGAPEREPEKPWCEMPVHRKVLDKGKPDDCEMGYVPLDGPEPVPQMPMVLFDLKGKVRLTFKLAEQTLVVGTKERTQRVPLASIRDCRSQPIAGHEAYHILALQFGPTDKSTKYFYWMPAQYVKSVINLFGK